MKPYCCQLTISSLARIFLLVDIVSKLHTNFSNVFLTNLLYCFTIKQFRGMVVSAILIGIFSGMSSVYLENLKEHILPNTTIRVDYHWNRKYSLFLSVDIEQLNLMAVLLQVKLWWDVSSLELRFAGWRSSWLWQWTIF